MLLIQLSWLQLQLWISHWPWKTKHAQVNSNSHTKQEPFITSNATLMTSGAHVSLLIRDTVLFLGLLVRQVAALRQASRR